MQVNDNDDLYKIQRSTEVKCGTMSSSYQTCSQRIADTSQRWMVIFIELKGQHWSNMVNNVFNATKIGQKNR